MQNKVLQIGLRVTGLVLIVVYFLIDTGEGNLKLDIQSSKVLMPAAYKVYSNPQVMNGQYYLFKMLVTNEEKKAMEDISISYRIPRYIEWTEITTIKRILPGQSVVVSCFPAFDDKIVEKMTSSQEVVEIKLSSGMYRKEESFAIEIKGRSDFVYTSIPASEISSYSEMTDNSELLACFVTPEDPIVQYYTQQIQEKILKGETASVTRDPNEAVRFLAGIYQAALQTHMVYSGTKGIPENFDDVNSLVQHLRLPREVITGNTGLCIELSLLYASIMSNAGLSPVIFLVPGHAFPGFVMNNQYFAIEATGIGGEGLGKISSPQEAFETGMKELQQAFQAMQTGDSRYQVIDINQLFAEGIKPMELRDDSFLRQKVDELARSFGSNSVAQISQPHVNGGQSTRVDESSSGNSGNAGLLTYSGPVNFQYPSDWSVQHNPNPTLPFLISQINSPGNKASAEVYKLPGVSGTDEAMRYLSQVFASYGISMSFQIMNETYNGYQLYSGSTSGNANTVKWVALFKVVNGGVVGFAVGAPSQYFSAYQQIFNAILSSTN